jgi:hypothetical protein
MTLTPMGEVEQQGHEEPICKGSGCANRKTNGWKKVSVAVLHEQAGPTRFSNHGIHLRSFTTKARKRVKRMEENTKYSFTGRVNWFSLS